MADRQRFIKWLGVVWLTVMMVSWSGVSLAADKMIGRMVWTKGSVTASTAGVMPRNLQRGSIVSEGDTIVTGQDGSGQIVFTDGSLVSLRSNTMLELSKYNFVPNGEAKDNSYVLNLVEGGFRTVTGLVAKKNVDGYQVKTPVATIGVRGTDYTVVYSQVEGLAVKLDSGMINLTNQAGQVDLSEKTSMIFSQIKSITQLPSAQSSVPSSFKEQPPPVKVAPPPPEAVTRVTGPKPGGLGGTTGKSQESGNKPAAGGGAGSSSSGPPDASGGSSSGSASGSPASSSSSGGSSSGSSTGGAAPAGGSQSIQVTPSGIAPAGGSTGSSSGFCISRNSPLYFILMG